jgi:hypothetical protein
MEEAEILVSNAEEKLPADDSDQLRSKITLSLVHMPQKKVKRKE